MESRVASWRWGRLGGSPNSRILLLQLVLVLFVGLVVVGHSIGVVGITRASLVLLLPIMAVAIALRPAWVLLLIVMVPTPLMGVVPSRAIVLLLLATLAGQFLTQGRLYLDRKSGAYPLLLLVALASWYQVELQGQAASSARGFWNLLAIACLLALVAYNATRLGDLHIRTFAGALIIGVAGTVLLEFTGLATSSVGSLEGIAQLSGKIGYTAVIGFSLCFSWLLLDPESRPLQGPKVLLGVLAVVFLGFAISTFVRAAWLSALIVIVLVAQWTGKRKYLLAVPLALLVIFSFPMAQERVLPEGSTGIHGAVDFANITTGRTELWDILWREEAKPALPFGNGYGHSFTLSSQRIFGHQTFQKSGSADRFVYPHNDFLYWTIEFGIIGFGAIVLFWSHLISAFRGLAKSGVPADRHSVIILAGILVTMLIVQLVDNSFAIRSVFEKFFPAAGFIFGLRAEQISESQSSP